MTTSENRRLDLREALTSVIGAHNTETLMESTPPFDWSEIATKSDLAVMSERIELRVESMLGRRLQTTTLALISVMVSLHVLTIGMVAWLVR